MEMQNFCPICGPLFFGICVHRPAPTIPEVPKPNPTPKERLEFIDCKFASSTDLILECEIEWLISRVKTLEAALEFYADCDLVTGRLARKALEDGE